MGAEDGDSAVPDAAGAVPVFVLSRTGLAPAPELAVAAGGPLHRCCLGPDGIVAMVSANGRCVVAMMSDAEPHTYSPPWPVAAVSCCQAFMVMLPQNGGPVHRIRNGSMGFSFSPVPMEGVPAGDPVRLLEAGKDFLIAVTNGDQAYGWGKSSNGQLPIGRRTQARQWLEAVPIESLSGKGILRLSCNEAAGAAETADGELLRWGVLGMVNQREPIRVGAADAGVRFPLRSLSAAFRLAAAADCSGCVWILRDQQAQALVRRELPDGERALKVCTTATCTIALAESGTLWECKVPCRSLHAQYPELPRGLTPFSGCASYDTVLAPTVGPGLLRVSGRVLERSEAEVLLCDAGVAAETVVEFLGAPPEDVQPAAEGPLVVFVRSAASEAPLCLEVDPGATVGGLAALAARTLGVAPGMGQ
eukprot:TRINITY_DN10625_c0_g1_i1.p1 TRINITY_DN10625_c0_g1~~TRINITY_DN10625_c0_g1_i1.p1  ORF type:complete len:438 (+),score=112.70 TRINITY_DN10625_c0_g1_i1:59-1315(+)